MWKTDIVAGAVLFISGAVLLSMSPDELSMILVGIMVALMAFGYLLSVLPSSHYASGFRRAIKFIQKNRKNPSANLWVAVSQADVLFMNDTLDELFLEYKEKVQKRSAESARSLYDVSDYINESVLELKTWQRVTSQIPSTLTALGILGTFIGLISGISGIHFSSVEVAVGSVQMLLSGISTAFYTSVSGVILSIVYTLVSRYIWNIMLQQMDRFERDFHIYVSDSADVRDKLLRNANTRDILIHLDKLISMLRSEEFGNGNDQ